MIVGKRQIAVLLTVLLLIQSFSIGLGPLKMQQAYANPIASPNQTEPSEEQTTTSESTVSTPEKLSLSQIESELITPIDESKAAALTNSEPAVPVPGNLTVSATDTTIEVMWDAVAGAQGYDVSLDGSVKNVNTNHHIFSDLEPNRQYSIKVRAFNDYGSYGVIGDIDGDGLVNAIDFALLKKYLLTPEEALSEEKLWAGDVNGDGTVNAIDIALMKKYLLDNSSRFPKSVSEWSEDIKCVTLSVTNDTQAPTLPENLVLTAKTSTSVSISWTASTDNFGVVGYDIFIDDNKIETVTDTDITIDGFTPNTDYKITVKARDAAGNVSSASNALAIKTNPDVDQEAPTAPGNLTSPSSTSTTVNLVWTASTDNVEVTLYEIYDGSSLVGITDKNTYTVTDLETDTAYTYTIKAKDGAGNVSVASNALTVKTGLPTDITDIEAPTAPSNLKYVSKSSTSVKLEWTASTDNVGVTSYEIYNGKTQAGATAGETSYIVENLLPNTTYVFSVIAKDKALNTSTSATITLKTNINTMEQLKTALIDNIKNKGTVLQVTYDGDSTDLKNKLNALITNILNEGFYGDYVASSGFKANGTDGNFLIEFNFTYTSEEPIGEEKIVSSVDEMETAIAGYFNNRVNEFSIIYQNGTGNIPEGGFEVTYGDSIIYESGIENIPEKVENILNKIYKNDSYLKFSISSNEYSIISNGQRAKISFKMEYFTAKNEEDLLDKKIELILSDIINPGMNVHEKEKAIHDYILLKVDYDRSDNENKKNSAYSALFEGKTICQGYALLAHKMLKATGIENIIVGGNNHAWNQVKIEDKWYHLDCTWDDGDKNTNFYKYYNLSDSEMSKDHTWDTTDSQVCNTVYISELELLKSDSSINGLLNNLKQSDGSYGVHDPNPSMGVQFLYSSILVKENEIMGLLYDVSVPDYLDKEIEWISSDISIVEVVDGSIIAKKSGDAFITIRFKNNPGYSDVCSVKVISSTLSDGTELKTVDQSKLSEFQNQRIQPIINIVGNNDISTNTTVNDCISDLTGRIEMLGHPVDIKTDSKFDWAEIGFKIEDDTFDTADLNDLVICWYDDSNNVIVPQATRIDYDNKAVYATVSHFSKYFLTYKNNINKKQINIVCVIDTIYASQDNVNKSVDIIKNMTSKLVAKGSYNINIYFIDTKSAKSNNFATNQVIYKNWNDAYAGNLISDNVAITDANKTEAEGVVGNALHMGENFLLNNKDSGLKLAKGGLFHNYTIGFLDGFWYFKDNTKDSSTMKPIVKYPNFDTSLLVCDNGLYFRGVTVNSSNLEEIKEVLPELLISVFEDNTRVVIPQKVKLLQNNSILGGYSNIIYASDTYTMEDEVERHITGYQGKVIVGCFSNDRDVFLAAGDDIIISNSWYDILAKLSSEEFTNFEQVTIGENGVSFNTLGQGKKNNDWLSITELSDLLTMLSIYTDSTLPENEEYLDDLAAEAYARVVKTNDGYRITIDGKTLTLKSKDYRLVNGRVVVDRSLFARCFMSSEEIQQALIAIEQADEDIIDGGIASVVSVDDLDISTNKLKVRMLSSNSMAGVNTNAPILYAATYGQEDKNGSTNIRNIQKALIKIHCWVGDTNRPSNTPATGLYGTITLCSVNKFLRDYMHYDKNIMELYKKSNSNQDGCSKSIADMIRLEAMYYIEGAPHVLLYGKQGADVAVIQAILKEKGYYNFSITGNFDWNTEKAVLNYQNSKHLDTDGKVGEETWKSLGFRYNSESKYVIRCCPNYIKYYDIACENQGTGNDEPIDDDIFAEKARIIHNESVRISNARSSLSASELVINEYYNKVVSSSQYNKIINSQNFLQRLAPELNALKTMPEYIKFNIARNMGLPFRFSGDFLNQNAIGEVWDAIHSLCLFRNQLIINGEFEKAEIVAEKIEYYLQHGTISGFSEYLVGLIASAVKDDIKGGARQVVQGNYCDDVTLSGTIGQVLAGIFGVDLPGDIRDVSYDISNWEWSKEHGIQFGIDMVGILPVFGVLKYGDEAKALIKGGNIADSVASAASRRSIRIINAVTEYSTMNRVKQIRGLLPSDLKRGGNFAIATVDIPGLKSEFYAHNLIDVLSDARSAQNAVADISVKPTKGIFQACYAVTTDGRKTIRDKDSEYKILSDIASKLGNNVNATGNIKLFTELEPCLSCQDVVIQLLQKYKNITIEVIHNNNKRLIP